MKTVFIRAIEAPVDEKAAVIRDALRGPAPTRFVVEPSIFTRIIGSPFVYWTTNTIISLFDAPRPFDLEKRVARVGLQTSDDFRFARLWTEVQARRDAPKWFPFAKGGALRPFYSDTHLIVAYGTAEQTWLREYGRFGRGADRYFEPGITWSRRPHRRGGFAHLPPGSIFSDTGPTAFVPRQEHWPLCAIFNSAPFVFLLHLLMPRGASGTSAQTLKYEVGYVTSVPIPKMDDEAQNALADLSARFWGISWRLDSRTEISHAFVLPALLQVEGTDLRDRIFAWGQLTFSVQAQLDALQAEIDGHAFRLYGISAEDRHRIEEGLSTSGETQGSLDGDDGDESDEYEAVAEVDPAPMVASLLSWSLGAAMGRFDVRLATGERPAPAAPEPFDPLPVCSPGMLTGDDGLPVSAPPSGYPLTFSKDGILVDDPGHPRDVVRAVRSVFEAVFDDANARWHEAAELLGTSSLRTWFARDFFELHISHYFKSRRKAPIYWQLATSSGSYSVWIYIHRATPDTLFLVLNDFVSPKLDHEKAKLDNLTQEAGATPSAAQRREIEQQETFVGELQALKTEVARVAPLWKPNLDDGVILNFAPLWRLVPQSRSWQGECKSAWEKLQSGDYDWAHIAMHLWPERVVPRCMEDRSLAIAHGLEDAFWVEDEERWRPRNPPDQEEKLLIRRYQREEIQELHSALSAVCLSHADVPASELWRMLEGKELDTTPLARLLWPRRIAERCLEDEVFAAAHNSLSPPERGASAKAREKWLKTYEVSAWSHLKTHVGAALRAAPGSAGQAWEALTSGLLDEQQLALRLWTARVVSKARADVLLAQHHDLERYFWHPEADGTWRPCSSPSEEASRALQSRTSTTVKAALRDLLSATATTSAGRKGKRRGVSPQSASPKPAPPVARTPAIEAAVDEATLDAVKAAIASVADGASKADVLAATGLSDGDWNKAIAALLDRGDVTRTGQKRGTRYHAGGASDA